jgi:predicted secreted protein
MTIIALFTCLLLQQQPSMQPVIKQDTKPIDTTRYSVLTYNKGRDSFLFDKGFEATTLTVQDIKHIEKITKVIVAEHNKIVKATNKQRVKKNKQKANDAVLAINTIQHPEKYYKQLIAVINAKGEKEVWVNCFCTDSEKKYWRKGVVMILDGGPCFFNLRINLTTNTVIKFSVNGVA